MTLPLLIRAGRDGRDGDLAFVVDTWRRSLNEQSWLCRFDRDVYFKLMAKHIGAVAREPGFKLRVACDPSDESSILGYAVLTGTELQYVYVRGGENSFREQGVAKMLLEGLDVKTYAFRTADGDRRIKPQDRGWTYQPRKVSFGAGKMTVEMA